MMKTFLLLAVSSVATAGALPSLPAKIILSAFVLMAVLTQAARRAPAGYEDEDGFHSRTSRAAVKSARPPWRLQKEARTEKIIEIPT